MILRNKRISKEAADISLHISYSEVDARKMVQWIFYCYYYKGSDWRLREILAEPVTEQDLLDLFATDWRCFGNFQAKWAETLAGWALAVCLRKKWIIQSQTTPNTFYFTDFCVQKKKGRPKNED